MDYYASEPSDDRVIVRVANMLAMGATKDEIRVSLLSEGKTEDEAYLAYVAGSILFRARGE